MDYYVYIWIRKDTNQVFYVGKGHKNRYKDMRMRNQYFLNVVNKVGMDNIEIKIIENNLSEDEAFEREIFYIDYYSKIAPLTNMTKGGEGSSNWYSHLSDDEKEHHKQISKSFLGKHHTDETKSKMSRSMTGLKHNFSEEGMESLRESARNREPYWKGKHLSDKTKDKMRKAKIGTFGSNAKSVIVIDKKHNIINVIRSRNETFNQYPYITQHHIRKCLETNSKINDISNILYLYDITFIYEKNYNSLKSQSTIETVPSKMVDGSNGVEYGLSENLELEVRGV